MERIILTETEFNRLKLKVKENKGKEIIFSSKDDELNRKVSEKLPVSGIMVSLEDRKDYMKQRNSGLNEVMAKILKKKALSLYFDFDEIFNSKNKERIFARIKQDIELCSRVHVQIKFILGKVKRDKSEIKSFFASLGAPTWMVKNCI
jgi:RNase P/RNase MRP subunit p30